MSEYVKQYDLYRHFDKDDNLLYVGISISALQRLSQHKDVSGWYHEISKITIEKFSSLDDARKAEKHAIWNELPKYNMQLNDDLGRLGHSEEEVNEIIDQLIDKAMNKKDNHE
ncbi:GIY-YIG nuclease family protein [Sulfurovum sp. XTW-4]|uniref:GIY-YIG nuclease family protein n=1 Tax=Sulfurovum xiamenensis TaxID=3019066 RepID=A0ABT7QUL3_9BACT|nr:GIY-YIG nuclease family protein [Sulfurovum xiamenensis]MDM5264777.1 GIY-YIG nuclease family protein [Sulfurovum xiamenensis]